VPWITFLFLAVMFFMANHDFFYSVKRMQAFNPSEDELLTSVAAGDLSRRIAFVGLGVFGALILMRKSRTRFRIRGALAWLAVVFVVWNFSSLAWAQNPPLTLRRLVVFGILCLTALGVSRRLSSRDLVSWILFSTASYLVIGFLAETVLGSLRFFAAGYRFAGTLHPNQQGMNCALLTLSGVAASQIARRSRNFYRALTLIGFVSLVLTGSRTAFAAAVLALLFYWSLVWPKFRTLAVTYCAITVFVFLLLVGGDASLPVLQRAVLLGRESSAVETLSGRVPVWQECLDYAVKRPLQGYGYGGFWTITHISGVSATQGWGVAEGHSAYLDLLLSVGLTGMVTFILMLALGIRQAVAHYRASLNNAYAFIAALLLFCALHGLLESTVVHRSMFSFVCMLALSHLAFQNPATSKRVVGL
jgi:O-antigen ligase